jgi:hypothetical protein
VHRQPDLFSPMLARVTSQQGQLFDPQDARAGDSYRRCRECGAYLVRTESGFLCCPAGHGRLIDERGNEPPAEDWPRFAARVAKRHQRDAAYFRLPPCQCGACRYTAARLTGRVG